MKFGFFLIFELLFLTLVSKVSASELINRSWAQLDSSDLEVPYVLTAAWVKSPSNMIYMRARSVKFQLSQNQQVIYLVDNEVPGLGNLYAFKITHKSHGRYFIDFVTGFNRIYFQAPFIYPEHALESPHAYAPMTISIPADTSLNFKQRKRIISIDLENYPYKTQSFEIQNDFKKCNPIDTQFCQVEPSVVSVQTLLKTSLHFRLAPQPISTSFRKKTDTGGKGVGYFATHPNSQKKSFIVKRDISRPIIWDVKVPAEMKTAVQDAAFYWNQVFGRQIIQIRDMPVDLDIWEPYKNSLIYYPEDPSGGAAGQFSTLQDGEIISSHIYVPSGFLKYAKASFDFYVSRLEAEGLSAVQIKKARQRFLHDYTVQTIAHEIGHSLGLRHNFKASSRSGIVDLHKALLNYLIFDKIRFQESPASSLMDYMGIDYFALMGSQIRQSRAQNRTAGFLPYDKYAIHWGYAWSGMNIDPVAAGPYCDLREDLAQGLYISPIDKNCASFDEPKGLTIIRLEIGTQKTILFGTKKQIFAQCESKVFDEALVRYEAPMELSIAKSGANWTLRKIDGRPFLTPKEVCEAALLLSFK